MSPSDTLFASLFEPKRIALIGASADVTKTTSRPQRFLRKHGFTGEILPVNPSRTEISRREGLQGPRRDLGRHRPRLYSAERQRRGRCAGGVRPARGESRLDPGGRFRRWCAAGASLQDELARIVRDTAFAWSVPTARHGSAPSHRWP